MSRKGFVLVLMLVVLLMAALPIFAQDGSQDVGVDDPPAEAPSAEAPPNTIVEDAPEEINPIAPKLTFTEEQVQMTLENLLRLIYDATFLPFAAGFVAILTAVGKRLAGSISSNVLAMFFTVMIWAIWIAANRVGYGTQFESAVQAMTILGSAFLGITVTPMAAGKIYDAARSQNVALVGYQRPVTMREIADAVYSTPHPPAEQIGEARRSLDPAGLN